MEEGGRREERRDKRTVSPARDVRGGPPWPRRRAGPRGRGVTSTGAPTADTPETRAGPSHRRAPNPGAVAVPAGRLPGGRTARPDEPPDDTSAGGPTADGRRTAAKPLFPSRGRNARRPPLPHTKRKKKKSPRVPPKNTQRYGPRPRVRDALQLLTRPTERLPDRGGRPDPCVPGRPPKGVRQHGRVSRPGEPTEGGEGERHGGTRASDGRGDGNGPRKAPHPGTERPLGRQTGTRGKPTGITPPRDSRGSPATPAAPIRPETDSPPGKPGKTQHGRLPTPPPPPKTLEREWAPTRPATRRGRPAVVPQRPHTPEREVDPAARPVSPAPGRGETGHR